MDLDLRTPLRVLGLRAGGVGLWLREPSYVQYQEFCRSTQLLLAIMQVIPSGAHQLTTILASFAKISPVIESLHCVERDCLRTSDK